MEKGLADGPPARGRRHPGTSGGCRDTSSDRRWLGVTGFDDPDDARSTPLAAALRNHSNGVLRWTTKSQKVIGRITDCGAFTVGGHGRSNADARTDKNPKEPAP